MTVGTFGNLAMFYVTFGAGNSGMFAWRGYPDLVYLFMAGAAGGL